ncbi:hypothetical protein Hypma_004392 [Hypsizygus marmoreus]|uniref:Uncharacterized protein n=1 Tax=Hypsizygus marmoreus TaxID=39966 RepID=A0A369JZY4_HYPMA|nr:hypothetical protein Hypma_004392 [Hypsizygus marmoreus]
MSNDEKQWHMPWKFPKPRPQYPATGKAFQGVAEQTGSESPHSVPASSWTGEHLIHMRILGKHTEFTHMTGMTAASDTLKACTQLVTALKALDESQIRLNDREMLKILREKDSTIMFAFYVMIRELLATPYRPRNRNTSVLGPALRPRKPKPADATATAAGDVSTDINEEVKVKPPSRAEKFDEAAYVPPKSQEDDPQPVDEFVTTASAGSFVSPVIALLLEGRLQPIEAGEAIRQVSVAQTYYPLNMTHGSCGCRTDGSMYVLCVGERGITHSRDKDVERVVDIEAKANKATVLLPQHVTELIGHMEDRLKKLAPGMNKKSYPSYSAMSAEQRTVYLLCFNGYMFRIVWMTFRPSYLEWIFGPLNDFREGRRKFYGKDDKPNPKTPANLNKLHQTVNVSFPRSLATVKGRIYAATAIIYFLTMGLVTTTKKSPKLDADILGCTVKELKKTDLP